MARTPSEGPLLIGAALAKACRGGRRGRCGPSRGRSARPSSSWTTSPTAKPGPAPRAAQAADLVARAARGARRRPLDRTAADALGHARRAGGSRYDSTGRPGVLRRLFRDMPDVSRRDRSTRRRARTSRRGGSSGSRTPSGSRRASATDVEDASRDPRVVGLDRPRPRLDRARGRAVEGVAELMPAEHPRSPRADERLARQVPDVARGEGFERFARRSRLGFLRVVPRVGAWDHARGP